MKSTLIIGAGGVGNVVVHKCIANIEIFGLITLASRQLDSCKNIAKKLPLKSIDIAQVNADDLTALISLIKKTKANIVINVALPYQDLTIMDACVLTGTIYLDTANYEHPDEAKFEYKLQWEKDKIFKNKKIMGLLGSGFDPGVTNVFCAYAQKHYFDQIHTIDILDCNAGDHGYAFATNFNAEINLREVSSNGCYWEDGKWVKTKPMQIKKVWEYPEIGYRDSYLIYHEELESLVKHIKHLKRIRFFMTFSSSYLTHMRSLQNVGMLGIKEIQHKGMKIVPIEFLSTLLPNPATLGAKTKGKTNIGVVINGLKSGKKHKIYIYNVCDHEACFKEVGSQAVSYTTGVAAMIGAKLMLEGKWQKDGVFNLEQLNPDPFMEELNRQGLPWKVLELTPNDDKN